MRAGALNEMNSCYDCGRYTFTPYCSSTLMSHDAAEWSRLAESIWFAHARERARRYSPTRISLNLQGIIGRRGLLISAAYFRYFGTICVAIFLDNSRLAIALLPGITGFSQTIRISLLDCQYFWSIRRRIEHYEQKYQLIYRRKPTSV